MTQLQRPLPKCFMVGMSLINIYLEFVEAIKFIDNSEIKFIN